MKNISINLISFTSNKSIGTLVYIKRLIAEISKLDIEYCFIFYCQKDFNISCFKLPVNHKIIRVPQFYSVLSRILFEQTLFYLYIKKTDFFYTPCLSMPLFIKAVKILTIHDMVPFILHNKYSLFRKYYIQLMTRICAHFCDLIITVSENSKKDIIKILRVKESKIRIIYNFISEDEDVIQSRPIPKSFISRFGFKKPFFLNVSTLQPGKNIEGLISAFNIFVNTNNNYHLYIVGNKGWGYNNICKIVKKFGLENKVFFTGYLGDEELAYLYELCYGVVYVSFYEGFGIPPLEGFYHNKPCIASNNSSLPEVVGSAAVLVDPYSIESISDGFSGYTKIHNELISEIKLSISKFDPAEQVRKFISIFSDFRKDVLPK